MFLLLFELVYLPQVQLSDVMFEIQLIQQILHLNQLKYYQENVEVIIVLLVLVQPIMYKLIIINTILLPFHYLQIFQILVLLEVMQQSFQRMQFVQQHSIFVLKL